VCNGRGGEHNCEVSTQENFGSDGVINEPFNNDACRDTTGELRCSPQLPPTDNQQLTVDECREMFGNKQQARSRFRSAARAYHATGATQQDKDNTIIERDQADQCRNLDGFE